jgi:hypothetical protein
MLVVREVYSDWETERRGTITIRRAGYEGKAPAPPGKDALAKRYATAGKILKSRLKTFLAFPTPARTPLPTRASSSAACSTSRWTTSTTRPASPPTRPAPTPTAGSGS